MHFQTCGAAQENSVILLQKTDLAWRLYQHDRKLTSHSVYGKVYFGVKSNFLLICLCFLSTLIYSTYKLQTYLCLLFIVLKALFLLFVMQVSN